jgi:hypothetical protein
VNSVRASTVSRNKVVFRNVAIVLGIICVMLAASLIVVITNFNSIISSLNSQIDFLDSQITFLQNIIATESFPPLPPADSARFIYSLHAYGTNPSWYNDYKGWGCAFFKTRSSESVPTSDMLFAENNKVMYYYTAISSDFVSYDGKDIYLNKNLDQVKAALGRPWCAGLYIHELMTYISGQNSWNWNTAINNTDWDYVNDCVHEAWKAGKKVMWSEPSYAWQTVYERRTADDWFSRTEWKEALIITFATNFPTQIWNSAEHAYATASRFQTLLGESIQDWYFVDQGTAATQAGTEWLGRMGWTARARYFEIEASNMNPSAAFMAGIESLVQSYGADKTPPELAITHIPEAAENHVSPQTAFTITATDANGTLATMYRIDGGEWQKYAGSFTLVGYGDGTHTVDCAAVDSIGNVAEITEQVYLDTNL